jgi:DNA polymerase III subunit delta'
MSNSLAKVVIGHDWATALLAQGLARNRVPHALLITGPPHIGKTTLAITLARMLNCTGVAPPCTTEACLSCRKVQSGNHPNVRILDDTGESLRIDQVRDLQRELSLSAHEGRQRVAVLCNFERATLEAANALLKTLEEPAPQVVLVLTTQEIGQLLPTIVSRCQVLSLRPLPTLQIAEALVTRWGASAEQAALLSQLASGRLGWAVRALQDETVLSRRAERLTDLVALLGAGRVERLAYAFELSRDPVLTREAIQLWLSWWRDVLLLRSGSSALIANEDWHTVLDGLSQGPSVVQVVNVVQKTCRALKNLDKNVNSRLNLEVLLLSFPFIPDGANIQPTAVPQTRSVTQSVGKVGGTPPLPPGLSAIL